MFRDIADVNDNTPEFEQTNYTFELSETDTPDTSSSTFFTVRAFDRDERTLPFNRIRISTKINHSFD